MMKEKLQRAKEFAKKYHLDYLAIAAGSVAVGALAYKFHMDHLIPEDCDAGIGVEPYFLDPETPGIRCNVYKYLKDGTSILGDRLIFDKEDFLEFDKLCLEQLETAFKVRTENE